MAEEYRDLYADPDSGASKDLKQKILENVMINSSYGITSYIMTPFFQFFNLFMLLA